MFRVSRLGGAAAVACLLTSLAAAQSAEAPASAGDSFYRAYYLENEQGDLQGALELYESVAGDEGASAEVRAAAEERGRACKEELAASDLARLVPEDTIAYVELNEPGVQISRLLGQLGLLQGSDGSGAVAISPLLIDGLLGVRGAALAITHIDPTGGPPAGVAILHPGDMDLVRGLLETALPVGGRQVDPIGGHDTWSIEGQALVTMTDRLVIASLDRAHIEGVLGRLEDGGKASLARNQDLAATLEMRGEDLLFFCVNAEPIMPQIQAMLGQLAAYESQAAAMALALLDVGSTQAIAGRIGVEESGVSFDLGLQLAEDHNNIVFNLLRMPHVTRSTLELIPDGTAFWVASTLNGRSEGVSGITTDEGEPVVTMMDFGREVFGNVVDVAVFAMPGTTEVYGQPIPDVALALTVNDPARSRAIWNLVLGVAKGASGGAGMEPVIERVGHGEVRNNGGNATVERFDIQGVGVYVMTDGDRIVFTPSARALAASVAGGGQGKTLLDDELYRGALAGLSEDQTMAMAVSPGRAAEIAKAYMGARELQELGPYLAMLDGAVVSAAVEHSATTLGLSARVDGLPKVGEVVSQLVMSQVHGGGSLFGLGSSAEMRDRAEAARWEAEAVSVEEGHRHEDEAAAFLIEDLTAEFGQLVARGHHDVARKFVEPIVQAYGPDPLQLNNFAWYLLTEDRYQHRYDDLALPIARKANELSGFQNWNYLDTLGHALAANGYIEEAIEVQTKAVGIVEALGETGASDVREALTRFRGMKSGEDL
jgi:hypothetical protein